MIRSNDHWPPHVHVIGVDGEARIALGEECEAPWLMTDGGLSSADLAAAMAEAGSAAAALRKRKPLQPAATDAREVGRPNVLGTEPAAPRGPPSLRDGQPTTAASPRLCRCD